ncbi:hypothetical protein EVAR_65201_1 [Eumeta japonica]|uniref:Uncharacterized protein n=1 Tax=Eumeta variegata TaxID=151549 RepID=A0A4C1ZIC5_EUMVA|nr:hypothetical protein EVAR_65201_1 [Eumeta japonica]
MSMRITTEHGIIAIHEHSQRSHFCVAELIERSGISDKERSGPHEHTITGWNATAEAATSPPYSVVYKSHKRRGGADRATLRVGTETLPRSARGRYGRAGGADGAAGARPPGAAGAPTASPPAPVGRSRRPPPSAGTALLYYHISNDDDRQHEKKRHGDAGRRPGRRRGRGTGPSRARPLQLTSILTPSNSTERARRCASAEARSTARPRLRARFARHGRPSEPTSNNDWCLHCTNVNVDVTRALCASI